MCGEFDRNENKAKNRPHIAIMLCNIQLIVFKEKKKKKPYNWGKEGNQKKNSKSGDGEGPFTTRTQYNR